LPIAVGTLSEMEPDFLFEVAIETSPVEKRPSAKAEK
jgi:hypothetical protein